MLSYLYYYSTSIFEHGLPVHGVAEAKPLAVDLLRWVNLYRLSIPDLIDPTANVFRIRVVRTRAKTLPIWSFQTCQGRVVRLQLERSTEVKN